VAAAPAAPAASTLAALAVAQATAGHFDIQRLHDRAVLADRAGDPLRHLTRAKAEMLGRLDAHPDDIIAMTALGALTAAASAGGWGGRFYDEDEAARSARHAARQAAWADRRRRITET
jgi:MoxR-like ATPase